MYSSILKITSNRNFLHSRKMLSIIKLFAYCYKVNAPLLYLLLVLGLITLLLCEIVFGYSMHNPEV